MAPTPAIFPNVPTLLVTASGLLFALAFQLVVSRQALASVARVRISGGRMPAAADARSSMWEDDDDDYEEDHGDLEPTPPPPTHEPLPPPSPRRPAAPPAAPLLQPDDVRQLHPSHMLAMRCGERIPPESILTTEDGASAVTVFVRANYQGPADEPKGFHAWRYRVEFTNRGKADVQVRARFLWRPLPHPNPAPRGANARALVCRLARSC